MSRCSSRSLLSLHIRSCPSSCSAAALLTAGPSPQPSSSHRTVVRQTRLRGPVDDRIFGVIPNYLTVEDPQQKVVPLTVKQKFDLFAKETLDPFTFGSSAAGAALSQMDNDNPKYGHGAGPYAERFGAAVADVTTQNFFSGRRAGLPAARRSAVFPPRARVRRVVSRGLRVEPRGDDADGRGATREFNFSGIARDEPGDRALERLLSRQQRERREKWATALEPAWWLPRSATFCRNSGRTFTRNSFHRKPRPPSPPPSRRPED